MAHPRNLRRSLSRGHIITGALESGGGRRDRASQEAGAGKGGRESPPQASSRSQPCPPGSHPVRPALDLWAPDRRKHVFVVIGPAETGSECQVWFRAWSAARNQRLWTETRLPVRAACWERPRSPESGRWQGGC